MVSPAVKASMPTSGRGTPEPSSSALPVSRFFAPFGHRAHHAAQTGFSLIEIMIVMVIIGIASSMVAIKAFPDRNQGLRQEAQRLVELFKLAQIEARADGRRIEWQFNTEGYRFARAQRYSASTLFAVRNPTPFPDFFEHDQLLHPRQWQTPLVRIEGNAMVFTAEWLLPPAQLILHSDEAQLTIVRDAAGHYEIH